MLLFSEFTEHLCGSTATSGARTHVAAKESVPSILPRAARLDLWGLPMPADSSRWLGHAGPVTRLGE